jgi:xanthine dehydrogenase molybdenum-binding subunit
VTEELGVVGRNVPRVDAFKKATGAAKYVADICLPNMLYGKLLRSPYAHAKIVHVDKSKAEKLEGVRAIITHKDVPNVLFGECGGIDAHPLPDRARFVGDEVLAVVADTREIAEKALELMGVQYEQLPAVFTPEESLKPGAPLIPPPEYSKSNLLVGRTKTWTADRGNIDEGFEQADNIFQDTFYTNFIQHMPIEPRGCVAEWDGEKLTVWVPSQRPFEYRGMIAQVMGLPENRVRLISPYIGGSFGSKYEGRYAILAALLARKLKRPVRFDFTKEEDMLSKMRYFSKLEAKIGVRKDGTFTSIHGKITTASGGYDWSHNGEAILPLRCLYRCPNVRYESKSVYTNHPPTGELRGVANALMTFAVDQMVDEMAEKLGFTSPMELIKKTHIQVGDECSSLWEKEGVVLSSCGLDECMERGAEAIGWKEKWKGWGTPVKVDGSKRVGMGMAIMTHHSGPAVFSSSAVVNVNPDGTVLLLCPLMEAGQGATTTQAQILSESSGIPYENIYVVYTDTEVTPLDPRGQVGSVSAHVASIATKLAGEDVKRQLLERAAGEMDDVRPEDLDIEKGRIFVKKEPKKGMTLKQLMVRTFIGLTPVVGRGSATCPHWPQKARNFGAHFAEVEVDVETGQVRVIKYVAAHDIGKAINPLIVEGQIQGAVVMGLSYTLSEQLVFDDKGKPLNLSPVDYKIFTSGDIPPIAPILVEPGDPLGAYGTKAFGEGPVIPVPACIGNAIYNAIGIRFRELPITPEKVLGALKESKTLSL